MNNKHYSQVLNVGLNAKPGQSCHNCFPPPRSENEYQPELTDGVELHVCLIPVFFFLQV